MNNRVLIRHRDEKGMMVQAKKTKDGCDGVPDTKPTVDVILVNDNDIALLAWMAPSNLATLMSK